MVEHDLAKVGVASSSLVSRSNHQHSLKTIHVAGIAQLVEHDLAKVGVASSSLVSRSNMQCRSHRVGRACSVLAKVGVASASLVAGSKNM